jgi:serine/threonine-protein kinase
MGESTEASERPLVEPKIGDVIAEKYRLDRVLGVGGMGTVYAAHHAVLDQTVAVKILAKEFVSSREIATRFLHETRAAAKLKSEHVARVMDAGTSEGGLPFLVMEHLEGEDLGARARDAAGAIAPEDVAYWAIQALEGLAHAHHAGIVHRDIKPGNLFLATRAGMAPTVKVLDFGISKGVSGGPVDPRAVTQSHQIVGSPGYMSPEQIKDASTVDARTDLWSLGVVMYELLTGKPPFPGERAMEIFSAVLERTPPSPLSLRPDMPEGLSAIVSRCLERERDDRFRDTAELARALLPFAPENAAPIVARIEQILHGTAPSERTIEAPTRSKRETHNPYELHDERPAGVPRSGNWLVVFVFAGIVAAGAYWLFTNRPKEKPPQKRSAASAIATNAIKASGSSASGAPSTPSATPTPTPTPIGTPSASPPPTSAPTPPPTPTPKPTTTTKPTTTSKPTSTTKPKPKPTTTTKKK